MTRHRPGAGYTANLALAVGSILLALLIFLGLETLLRFTDAARFEDTSTSRLKYQNVVLPLLEPASRPDGAEVLQTVDQRLPYQTLLRDRPSRSITVAMFGGSAIAGLGFSPNMTIARSLESMLRSANPDHVVDVLNFGIVALSSRQVKRLVADVCERYDLDLIVVYSGNNEFLEIHAEKYAAAHAGWFDRLGGMLMKTHLYRIARRALRGPPRQPSLADSDLSSKDLRLTQRAIVRDIELTSNEKEKVIQDYRRNLAEIVATTKDSEIPLVLMSVASNWKWRGREDLPTNWLSELLNTVALVDADQTRLGQERIDRELLASSASDRHEWLFRRAVLAESQGDFELARTAYRSALNEDPHLRRALDRMNDELKQVARDSDVTILDTVELLSKSAKHGIVGFDEFYDYVHFTPRGALLVATELFEVIGRSGVVRNTKPFDSAAYFEQELDRLEQLPVDEYAVDRWVGFGFDRKRIADRDLWKYDELLQELDDRIEEDPEDFSALVYRGNIYFFRLDGAEQAESDYRAALELAPNHPIVRSNLERLLRERGR